MKQKLKIICFSIVLLLILGLLSFGIVQTNQFNKTKTVVNYASDELFIDVTEADCLSVDIKNDTASKKDTELWKASIDDKKTNTASKNYESIYYTLCLENKGDSTLTSYAVKVSTPTFMYLHTGWCGTFEIHQFRDGKEKIQELDFNKLPKAESEFSIDVIRNYDEEDPEKYDWEIPLEAKDYFLYLPSAEAGYVPLYAKHEAVYPGFIVLAPTGTAPVLTAAQEIRTSRVANTIPNTKNPTSITMNPRDDTWNKIIDPSDKGITQPDYMGQTYDIIFMNNSKNTLKNYSLVYTCETEVYLSSAWNGSVEVHQGSRTMLIEDLRSFNPQTSTPIQYIKKGSEIFIPLSVGDSITYYPSEEESTLRPNQSVTTGMILYSQIGTEIYGSAVLDLSYHMSLLDNTFFLASFIALILWFLFAVFEVLFQVRIASFRRQKEHQEKIIVESIETFTGFIDAKDPYTNGHSHRVAYYTKIIADMCGYNEEDLQRIYYIALLHDCGKIGIPDSILTKPAKLTDEEYAIIKSHPVLSAQVLNKFTSIEGIREGVLYHHERWDGKGYPEGKKGEEIPKDARIICIADSFDAMNSNRCYRSRLTKDEIVKEFETNKGTQFDPELAEIMIFLILSGKIDIEA